MQNIIIFIRFHQNVDATTDGVGTIIYSVMLEYFKSCLVA